MMTDTDTHEVYDLVQRNEPISFDALMEQIWTYSKDDVYTALERLKSDGRVAKREGDIHKDGTTRNLWFTTDQEAT